MGLCCCKDWKGHLRESKGGAGDREKMPVNHEAFLLMANSQNDMEDWVKAIRRVIWAPFGGGIFGQRLEDTVQYERKYGHRLAPLLVEQCVDFIRERGLTEEGLFRMPGQANLVKDLQDSFDCGEKPLFDSTTDVHTVASLLKLYLRELPEPVIPFAKYEDFLSCAQLLSKDESEGTLELAKQVKNLPQANYNLLKYICKFLDEVQAHSNINKMSVQNLATVFGPNILRPKKEDPVTIMEGWKFPSISLIFLVCILPAIFYGGWTSNLSRIMVTYNKPHDLPLLPHRIEEASSSLKKQMARLEEDLDQERKKFTMLEIRLRNSERAREDAEKRNQLLQKEMEEFFSTLGTLTLGSRGTKVPK